jgi:cell division septum initiation protein DivIVA
MSLKQENTTVRRQIEELKQKIEGYEKSNHILIGTLNKVLTSKLI